MNDNDIIKALENCKNNGDCKDCILNPHVGNYGYCTSIAIEAALDLINRQKAEIDTLKAMIEAAEDHYNPLPFKGIFDEKIKEAKSEAIKEFAERLKEKSRMPLGTLYGRMIYEKDIDNLVEEMTEETP